MRRFGAIAFILVFAVVGAAAYFYLKDERPAETGEITAQARLSQLEALAEDAPDSTPADEDGLQALADALDGFATIEIGSVDAAPAGPLARDVVFRLTSDTDVGVRVDELRAWGVNAEANGSGDVRIADRIDARGVEWFGFGELIEAQSNAYVDAIESSMGELAADTDVEMDLNASIEQYELGADRFIIDGLVIHAREEAADSEDDGVAGAEEDGAEAFLSVMKMFADSSRRASFDASAVYGLRMSLSMDQATGKTDMTMQGPFTAMSGWRRGDLDFYAARDFVYDMGVTVPETVVVDEGTGVSETTPEVSMQIGGGYEFFSLEDLKLARLYEFLSNETLPPTSETDFLSLGVWRIRGEHQSFNGHEISTTEEATIDLSNFHWFVPTEIEFAARGVKYDLGALFTFSGDMAAASSPESGADLEQLEQLVAALEETGLDVVSYDMEMQGRWRPENGETTSFIELTGEEVGDWRQSFEGTLPDFEVVETMAATGEESFDWGGVSQRVLEASSLRRYSLEIADKGGLDKGFAMAVAMAKLAPEDDPGAAMMRNADPADLRISSAAMIRLMAPQAAQAFPPATEYITAVADFIQKGGVLRAEANPPAPVTAELLEGEREALQADPARFAELLGLTVVHEPPEADSD